MSLEVAKLIIHDFLCVHNLQRTLLMFEKETATKDSPTKSEVLKLLQNALSSTQHQSSLLETLVGFVFETCSKKANGGSPVKSQSAPDCVIIDDDIESETLLGGGKSGLVEQRLADSSLLHHGVKHRQEVKSGNPRGQAALVAPVNNKTEFHYLKTGPKLLQQPCLVDNQSSGQSQVIQPRSSSQKSNSVELDAKSSYKLSASSMVLAAKETHKPTIGMVDEPILPLLAAPPCIAAISVVPMDIITAKRLRQTLFGSSLKSFPDSWKYTGFTFSQEHRLQCFITQQSKTGCGAVLAVVQAYVFQQLLFMDDRKPSIVNLTPSPSHRTKSLGRALAQIVWKAGEGKQAVIALPSGSTVYQGTEDVPEDNLLETLNIHIAKNLDDLYSFIDGHLYQFELAGNNGVMLLVYSLLLSKGLKCLEEQLLPPLISASSASQSLLTLFLCGQPYLIDGEGRRSDFGLLMIEEHQKKVQVGSHLKTPRLPIWLLHLGLGQYGCVVCMNPQLTSHWRAERLFDVYLYHPCLTAEVRLTIDCTSRARRASSDDDEYISPVEHCLRTKWKDATIDWNGSIPFFASDNF